MTSTWASHGKHMGIIIMTYLHSKLSIFSLLCVGGSATPPEVGVEVVEDDLVPGHHHTTYETHEAPVLSVDATIGVWLVCGLLDELQVELVAESFFLHTLLQGQLYHGDTVLGINLLKPSAIGWCNTFTTTPLENHIHSHEIAPPTPTR